ncbi:MBL fold metallo-hydrolase [Bacillus tianshenii]|uniref:MBL fold metallo-hydrolase n=1 Tax=Sutcliffiella tianshenii TaxID=1463404 RepID=UPI001CD5F921|nr:MBL fold metallo-hydrolase [Bacillus tianshenii]MCA1320037.1 MBL fold metallo-hydrolase [Bacillus tianshenii]
MDFQWITDRVGYFQGAVNIGYVKVSPQEGLLVDAGLDDQAMKKVLKSLKMQNLPLTHLFITHAHADHYGGAAYLQKMSEVNTLAPELEAAILQNPMIEPLYLYNGAYPMDEWRNKFLEGKPVRIDTVLKAEGEFRIGEAIFRTISLSGHSYNQSGLFFDNILFASDGYFGVDALEKHGIPFIVDAERTMDSLEKIKKLPCKGAVPGHGRFEEDHSYTIDKNIALHKEIERELYEAVKAKIGGISLEELVSTICTDKGIIIKNPPSYMLFRTAITAYLTKLIKEKQVRFVMKENQLLIEPLSR